MSASVKVRRCSGCGHKVLEATCNRAGYCVACMLAEIANDSTLETLLAKIRDDKRLDALLAEMTHEDLS